MKMPRFGTPLALVRDRFILAVGGMTGVSPKTSTQKCEVFDTQTNHWFPMKELPLKLVNTCCVVLNSRFVYVMPGSNPECAQGSSLSILMLDSGGSANFAGDKNIRSYGLSIGS